MLELLAVVLGIALIIAVASARGRLRELELRVEELQLRIRDLTARVYVLEGQPVAAGSAAETAPELCEPPPLPPQAQPAAQEEMPPRSEPEAAVEEPLPEPVPAAAARVAVSEDWESKLGGNWLNKLGVLVLVIGIALFLGYSLTRLGPAGRVAVGLAVGLSLLGTGIALERRDPYQLFGRGLLGGGWAAIYVTAYAMHALPAARLITEPAVGMAVLLAVAAAMVAHSLRYRSETVSAVAYIVAFLTLLLASATGFSTIASIPLAASLLSVSWRLHWARLPLAGLALLYLVYWFGLQQAALVFDSFPGRPLLWVYWLLFEGFDILWRYRRAGRAFPLELEAMAPLNACAFLGATLLSQPVMSERSLRLALPVAAVAYVASALLRARAGRRAAEGAPQPVRGAGFELSVALAAFLFAGAIFRNFRGDFIHIALLLEAELLVLAGLRLRNPVVRWLGGLFLLVALCKLLFADIAAGGKVVLAGSEFSAWLPMALLTAGVFSLNRALLWRARSGFGPFYSSGGLLLMMIVAGDVTPARYLAAAWLALAAAHQEIGLRARLAEFRILAGITAAATFLGALCGVAIIGDEGRGEPWGAFGLPAAIALALLFRPGLGGAGGFEKLAAYGLAGGIAVTSLLALLAFVVPSPAVALAWMLVWLVLLWSAGYLKEPWISRSAAAVAFAVIVRLVSVNFAVQPRSAVNTAFSAAAILGFYGASLFHPRASRLRAASSVAATLLLAALLYVEVAGRLLTVAWSAMGILLVVAGVGAADRVLRLSGLAVFLFCVLKAFFWDMRELDTLGRILSFIGLGLLLVAASWIYTRFGEKIRRYL